MFTSEEEAFAAGITHNDVFDTWDFTEKGHRQRSIDNFVKSYGGNGKLTGILLNEVKITAKNANKGGDFAGGFINSDPSDMQSASAFVGYAGLPITKTEALLKYTAKTATSWTDKAYALRTVKSVAKAGKAFGVLGSGLTAYESYFDGNGFTVGDGVKVGLGLITTFTPYGWVYGAVDIGVGITTGTTLTDRIGNSIDKGW